MRTLLLLLTITIGTNLAQAQDMKTFHDFKATTLEGEEIDMSQFKGKKVMVVNVASKCGYTPQYETLQEVYSEFGGEKFEIIGFPSNQFMGQEPGTAEEIATFCKKNYGVTFTMMSKIDVKGKDQHPLYSWLTKEEENGVEDAKVKWNFQKFLIDENGKWVKKLAPGDSPADPFVQDWLSSK